MATLIGHLDGRIAFVDFSSRKIAMGMHVVQLSSSSPSSSSSPVWFSTPSTSSASATATSYTDSAGNYTLPPARAAPQIRRLRLPAPPEHLPGAKAPGPSSP